MLHLPRARTLQAYPHPAQQDIRRCPNFLPSRPELVLGHPEIPAVVKQVIEDIPWTRSRKYRGVLLRTALVNEDVGMTGCFWHIDVAGETADHAGSYDDLHLWLITFGEVRGEDFGGTEFITTPLDLPEVDFANPDYTGFSRIVEGKSFDSMVVPSGQLVQYSTWDVHRGLLCRPGLKGYRMTVICAESDHIRPIDMERQRLSAGMKRPDL